MKKKTEEIEVEVSGDQISICQPCAMMDNDMHITVSPDQVDLLCKWLKEAKEEIDRTN